MKIAKILSTMALSLLLLSACGGGKGIITVNDEPITKADYDAVYKQATSNPQFAAMAPNMKDPDSFFGLMTRDRLVNELIVKKILDQEIKKRGIKVSEEDIKAAKDDIITKVGGEEQFKALMKQNNVSEKQLREDIINEVKVNKLVEATADVKVSDSEVKDFYNKNKKNFDAPDRVRASHILIEANPEALRQAVIDTDKKGELNAAQIDAKIKAELDKKLTMAKDLKEKLVKNPKDFEKLAKEYSADTVSAKKGGDLGFFTKDAMVKPFADASFALKPNTISDVVQTQYGYHIIMVTDRAKAGLVPFDQVAPEIKAYLEQTKKVDALQKLFHGLKSSAKVVYVDSQYDPKTIQDKIRQKATQQAGQQEQGEGNPNPFTPAQK